MLTYRPLRANDLPVVSELHRSLLPVRYSKPFFLHLLIAPDRLCYLAVTASGVPVAFVSALLHDLPGIVPRIELLTLGVAPAYQHCGVATRLVKSIHDALRARLKSRPADSSSSLLTTAHVAATNASAISFYERLGLCVIPNPIIGHYRTGSGPLDAFLVMGRVRL